MTSLSNITEEHRGQGMVVHLQVKIVTKSSSGSEMVFIRLRSRNIEVVIFPKIWFSQYPVLVWIVRDHHGESGSER